MSTHGGSVLDALRRHPDPAASTDPEVRAIVDALGRLEIAPAPRAEFRDELRAQLVAIAPRLIDEGAAGDAAPAKAAAAGKDATRASAPAHAEPRRRRSFARPLTIAASVVLLLAMLLGGVTWYSQKSVPGDSLYGVKRASESLRLALASDPAAQADDRLHFATRRVEEVRDLVEAGGSGRLSTQRATLVASTLRSANDDVTTATRQLNTAAMQQHSGAPLSTMLRWAPGQLGRLQSLTGKLTDPSLRADAITSSALVKSAWTRVNAVRTAAASSCPATSVTDRFGPVPAANCTASTAPATSGARTGSAPTHAAPASTHPASRHSGAATRHAPAGGTTRSHAPSASTSKAGKASSVPQLPIKLPTKSAPITIRSCGLSISLGPIGANVGTCPSGH